MRIGWKAAVHDPRIASFRYRVAEPVAALAARGHQVELFAADAPERYDLVVFSKSYRAADQAIARAVRARGGRVALDLCDNHFYNPYHLPRYQAARAELIAMIGLADRLIVSTPALGQVVRAEAGLPADPFVVGDVAERIVPPPRPDGGDDGRPILLWFGSHGSPNAPSGMTDLLAIAPALRAQAARTPFELVVASNDAEKFARLAPELGVPARYVAWTHEGFPALLAGAAAVVIPLSDNPFVACKTHNRMSAALWPGVPVIADTIDSYREFAPFAWLDDWPEGLRMALEEPAAARARAAGARAYIDAHWTMDQLAPRWEEALGLRATLPADAPAATVASPVGRSRALLHQAALDPAREDRVTGWARAVAHPGRPVRVTLEADGAIVAEATADLPRPDLAAAGFADSACGFEVAVPDAWRDGAPRAYRVVADGVHVVETATGRFHAPADAGRRAPAPPSPAPPDDGAAEAQRNRQAVRLQKRLADELELLTQAVEHVRRVAARIVLAATGGDREGRPLEIDAARPDHERDDAPLSG